MKDLRLICYGEQAYGSGSKGPEHWRLENLVHGKEISTVQLQAETDDYLWW